MLNKIFHHFERIIVLILLFLMGLIIIISTIELIATVIDEIISHDRTKGYMFLEMKELLQIFSFILLIVIGLELFETIKYYLNKHIIQADFILLVALTAIARKVIILDYSKADEKLLIGLAATIIALSVGYYLIKRANKLDEKKKIKNSE